MPTMLRVDVHTHECTDDEAFTYMVPEGTDMVAITRAIQTLYKHQGVRRLDIEAVEVEDEEE